MSSLGMRNIWLVAAKWMEQVGLVSMFGFWRIEMMSGSCPIRKQAKSSKQPRSIRIRSPFVVASKVGKNLLFVLRSHRKDARKNKAETRRH